MTGTIIYICSFIPIYANAGSLEKIIEPEKYCARQVREYLNILDEEPHHNSLENEDFVDKIYKDYLNFKIMSDGLNNLNPDGCSQKLKYLIDTARNDFGLLTSNSKETYLLLREAKESNYMSSQDKKKYKTLSREFDILLPKCDKSYKKMLKCINEILK